MMIFNSIINLKTISNISIFFISVFSLYSCVSYYNNCSNINISNPNLNSCTKFVLLDTGMYLVNLHVFIDLFINESYAMRLHHLFVLGIFFYNNYYNVSFTNRILFLYPLIKTEISSIFLILKTWIPKNNFIYHINSILFYLTFLKFRIIDFYNEVLYDNKNYHYTIENYSKNNILMSLILLVAIYGLYILNMYWFLIINKIFFKNILNRFNSDLLSQYICSYLLFLNIPLSIYIYSYNPNKKYIFDLLGITILSICSYKYHYDVYYNLKIKKIEEYITEKPNNTIIKFYKSNMVDFYNDLLSINLRSFLNIVTNYYNNSLYIYTITFSSLIHLSMIYFSTIYIMDFLKNDKIDNFSFTSFRTNNIIAIFPDVICVFYNSNKEIAIPFLLTNILIALLFIVKPFYKLTHVAFHALLIVQNYYLSLSILNSD